MEDDTSKTITDTQTIEHYAQIICKKLDVRREDIEIQICVEDRQDDRVKITVIFGMNNMNFVYRLKQGKKHNTYWWEDIESGSLYIDDIDKLGLSDDYIIGCAIAQVKLAEMRRENAKLRAENIALRGCYGLPGPVIGAMLLHIEPRE